jgi:hypothetical protein
MFDEIKRRVDSLKKAASNYFAKSTQIGGGPLNAGPFVSTLPTAVVPVGVGATFDGTTVTEALLAIVVPPFGTPDIDGESTGLTGAVVWMAGPGPEDHPAGTEAGWPELPGPPQP